MSSLKVIFHLLILLRCKPRPQPHTRRQPYQIDKTPSLLGCEPFDAEAPSFRATRDKIFQLILVEVPCLLVAWGNEILRRSFELSRLAVLIRKADLERPTHLGTVPLPQSPYTKKRLLGTPSTD